MLSAALMPKHVEAFFDELGIADLLEDPRFSTREARIKNKDVVRAAMLEAFESDTAENWEKRLAPRGVPISKVNSVAETSALEQLQHRNILTDVPAAMGMEKGYRLVGAPFVNSEDGPEPTSSAPTLGQHSREILAELGIDNTTFDQLLADGVIHVTS
jgi:formyl-CoA transferase